MVKINEDYTPADDEMEQALAFAAADLCDAAGDVSRKSYLEALESLRTNSDEINQREWLDRFRRARNGKLPPRIHGIG